MQWCASHTEMLVILSMDNAMSMSVTEALESHFAELQKGKHWQIIQH